MQGATKRVLTLLLPVIAAAFVAVPATALAKPKRVSYVLVRETKGCLVTLNDNTGKLTFKAEKGHFGHFTVVVRHGKKKITYRFTVTKPKVKSKPPVVTVIKPPGTSPPIIIIEPTVPVVGPTGPPGPGTPTTPPTPTPSPTAPTAAHPPVNLSPPVLRGTPVVGDTITLTYGTWSDSKTQTGTWYDCDAQGKQCSVDASQPPGDLYVVQPGDLGHSLLLAETATGPGGKTTVDSAPTAVVTEPPPSLISPPVLSGTPVVGQTITLAYGTWKNSTSQTGTWYDCDGTGQDCSIDADQPAGNVYVVQSGDVGHSLVLAETATGPGGRATADSQPTAVVTAAASVGAGAAFCDSYGGLSADETSLDNVYPCANPNITDQFGSQCVEFSERFESVVYGEPTLVGASILGRDVASDYHSQDGVPLASPGVGVLPVVGDIFSMWGDANQDPSGHTGVVAAVNVNAEGNGVITIYDENSYVANGVSRGGSPINVNDWQLSNPLSPPYDYTSFDWTVQGS